MTGDQSTGESEVKLSTPPRLVAVSGFVFSLLFIMCLILIRLAVPADPNDPAPLLAEAGYRQSIAAALNLVPFTGIAFIWFMAVLRNRIGLLEDRFFATVFLGSGLLFVAMLYVTAAVSAATLERLGAEDRLSAQSETFMFGRRIGYALMNVYAIKMAAVFMFVTSSIGIRTAFLPRWLAFVGFALGAVLLLAITDFAWIALLFPTWVIMVSAFVLAEGRRTAATDDPRRP
jgi:hypothetical protein